jgi:hypothetical protein
VTDPSAGADAQRHRAGTDREDRPGGSGERTGVSRDRIGRHHDLPDAGALVEPDGEGGRRVATGLGAGRTDGQDLDAAAHGRERGDHLLQETGDHGRRVIDAGRLGEALCAGPIDGLAPDAVAVGDRHPAAGLADVDTGDQVTVPAHRCAPINGSGVRIPRREFPRRPGAS